MTQRIDRIAQLLNCPLKGEDMRRAITEARKDFLLDDDEEDDDEDLEHDDAQDPSSPA
ncbi:hypothetical protein SAMN04487857_11723 [Pseudomonas sp. ok272]|uniref:hypothetical protein n=1 Tax=unclassified Pseudomonas TaxID=196821 RepID=UPI0008B7FDFE|nr:MULTISPECIES: hypothetical protein [unclassified Pseudomonas]SEN44830.1 hypothetical protein SAMN04487857_11723 [Pseudomonas sp. ok272]SFM80834.1 hypothetical protein SAMN04487858_10723 [Pseudomonas sp. ok602]